MKKFRIFSLILLAALVFTVCAPAALALDDPQIDCYAAVLQQVNGDQVTTIYSKNADDLVYPASLTKVMTVLVTMEAIDAGEVSLTDVVTAQPGLDFDLEEGGTSAWIYTGEKLTLQDLLYCALLGSANDACNVIAQYVGGSIGGFVARMNEKAAALGCTYTQFANTHGLSNSGHYTTAGDFMKIFREACKHDLFIEISGTVNYTVPATDVSAERNLSNSNSLINPSNPLYPGDYVYNYCKGGKTGHTSAAGYCLAAVAEKDGVTLISVVFNGQARETEGDPYYEHFADTRTLFDWGFDNFSEQEIVKSTEIVGSIPVEMGADGDTVAVRPATSISAYLPNDADPDSFERTITLYSETTGEPLEAPVNAGQAVGEMTVSKDGVVYGKSVLVTSNSVDRSRVEYMKNQIGDTLRKPVVILSVLVLAVLIITYLLIVIRYRAKRRAYQRRLANAKKMRFDLEEEEDEVRYERRVKASRPTYAARPTEVSLEPESYAAPEDHVDEPTRVEPAASDFGADEPTKIGGEPIVSDVQDDEFRDYFEEFFGKK